MLSVCFVAALASPVPAEHAKPVDIVNSSFETNPDGSYTFSFEGADGSSRQEKGTVIHAGEKDQSVAVEGSYRYVDDQNKMVEVHYTGDEKGFIAEGEMVHPSITKNARTVAENPPDMTAH